MTFKKGVSGNPLGRKPAVPGALTAKDALTTAAPHAVAALIRGLRNTDPKIQLAAADMILRRVFPSGIKIEVSKAPEAEGRLDLSKLSVEELGLLRNVAAKAVVESIASHVEETDAELVEEDDAREPDAE